MNAERSITRSLIVRVEGDRADDPREDLLAVEEPLEIQLGYERKGWRIHKSVSITMRTPGADTELAAGFLFTEGIVTDAAQIDAIHCEEANVARVELRDGVPVDLRRLERHFYTTSSCGVCGKASIAALDLGPRAHVSVPGTRLRRGHGPRVCRPPCARPRRCSTRRAACTRRRCSPPTDALVAQREDVGRHNAVDKLIGSQLRGGTALRPSPTGCCSSAGAPASSWCRRRSPPACRSSPPWARLRAWRSDSPRRTA